MALLDFTIEFNTDLDYKDAENTLFAEADAQLRSLAEEHNDLTGAAITIREPASGETVPVFEATIVTYARPNNIAATEKAESPEGALRGALNAVERQVREKRTRLRERREKGIPVSEMVDVAAVEGDLLPGDVDEEEQES